MFMKFAGKSALAAAASVLVLSIASANAAEPESCGTVRFSDVGWTDITATTAATSVVLEALGYETKTELLSVPVTYTSLKNKDIDVFLGNWMPSMAADVQPFLDDKSVESITENLTGAGYGIVVSQDAFDAGVKSLSDLEANADKFDGKIYGIEPGNDGNRIILDWIKDGSLANFELVESSEAGMISQAQKVMKNGEWVAFLGWTPHPIMGAMDIAYLDGMGDSGFGAATVHTNVRQGYLEECPNVGQFLKNLKFTLDMENVIMGKILDDGEDAKVAATEWLKAHPDAYASWLEGVTTKDGGNAAEAVKSALGS
ncbi:choline ABC transporter substrate-binding protein [Rhizobium sp. L1K21]|uniref:choline ABC transporter substrate-binding protein n=1 Tax=Rhizobium sp. L1K21 TaxID=2954933 RepID=UPI0020938F48|nr:choline ABC transporter substrate-binding protein [Rhizobium sp. L1K21]MCO6185382.1 choline ABC transporter substrate-binding protein [Rhizobium sp. L1K21]